MGAWGTGPFDSDGALDYLGDFAENYATRNADGDTDPETINHAGAAAELAATLEAITRPDAGYPAEYRSSTIENAYAAAGLVAAVLNPPELPAGATGPTGTRLFAGIASGGVEPDFDALGLLNDCGYKALLHPADAAALQPAAVAAVAAIRTETYWISEWNSDEALYTQLDRLTAALSA